MGMVKNPKTGKLFAELESILLILRSIGLNRSDRLRQI